MKKETRGGYRPRAGRPTNEEKGMGKKVQKSFSLYEATYEKARAEAEKNGISVSELVERLITAYTSD